MEQKKYKVAIHDTMESIAEETGYSVEEIIKWHNAHSYRFITKAFDVWQLPLEIQLPDYPPKPKPKPTPEEKEKLLLESLMREKESKYRCEQSIVTKINSVIQNYVNTKSEFLVRKQQTPNGLVVKNDLTDSIMNVYPPSLEAVSQLMNDLELLKCNTVVQADADTGKIARILNHKDIIKNWEKHKTALLGKFSFIRAPQPKEELSKFVSLVEKQITNEQNLIQELSIKMFFGLFFDRYLVGGKLQPQTYAIDFNSSLFEGVKVPMQFTQNIVSESEEKVEMSKTGVLDKKKYVAAAFEKMYDTKYKPAVKYKFSGYNMLYSETCAINTKERLLETADVTIVEEVTNNVEIDIRFNLKKVKL